MDKIRNEMIMSYLGVVPIDHKIRKMRLTWFNHVKKRSNVFNLKYFRLVG